MTIDQLLEDHRNAKPPAPGQSVITSGEISGTDLIVAIMDKATWERIKSGATFTVHKSFPPEREGSPEVIDTSGRSFLDMSAKAAEAHFTLHRHHRLPGAQP